MTSSAPRRKATPTPTSSATSASPVTSVSPATPDSSAAPRREAVLAYSGGTLDRAGNQRTDPAWVDAILAAPGTRLIPMWRDQCVVSGGARCNA